ncbi:lactoylglutathione lyase/glyoxylase I family protein [Paenibacillus phyllosphaerae]|uniref:Lactoylglutathione lyase/glyoxylase I family protein n=1 Tax=Paenibacillus phyllosphaerae TaxID=274593 RepID=A0A7W5B142_9BACL|nr:VOC family protein [Paenibacillus phyllosphaerae]MBB3112515.1 lactoylglutathione lyase/glyoxylase I family protein [Paenibacillus phyllosphaerae]
MSDSTHWQKNETANPIASLKGHHIAVRVPDYEEAKNWYVEKLGFRVIQEWPFGDLRLAYIAPPHDDSFCLEIIGDGVVDEAVVYTDVNSSMHKAGYHHLCMTVGDVDQSIAYLKSNGVALIGEPFNLEAIHRRLAFFADPWGNLFELAQVLD